MISVRKQRTHHRRRIMPHNRPVTLPLALLLILLSLLLYPAGALAAPGDEGDTHRQFLPLLSLQAASAAQPQCDVIPAASYASLSVASAPSDRPAAEHPDLNLRIRWFEDTVDFPGLVWYSGPTDLWAPQLNGLFQDRRLPRFTALHQVYEWDWACGCRTNPISRPSVTLASLATSPLEVLYTPPSGYDIGGYEALVLYADAGSLTLKYTREDNVISGYTVHVEGVCVEASLLALYETMDGEGRRKLPALAAGQAFGRAAGGSIRVGIRDTGRFMDPRSGKDWWQNSPQAP